MQKIPAQFSKVFKEQYTFQIKCRLNTTTAISTVRKLWICTLHKDIGITTGSMEGGLYKEYMLSTLDINLDSIKMENAIT